MHYRKSRKKEIQKFKDSQSGLEFQIFKENVITEKSVKNEEENKVLCFICNSKMTKPIIKASIQKIFEVKVIWVNVLNEKGKWKAFKGKSMYKLPDRKKVMVKVDKLPTGGVN